MKTKIKWYYTIEAIPNEDKREYLCVVRGSMHFMYDMLAFDAKGRQWMRASVPFDIDHVVAWARLPAPEDIVDDENEQ